MEGSRREAWEQVLIWDPPAWEDQVVCHLLQQQEEGVRCKGREGVPTSSGRPSEGPLTRMRGTCQGREAAYLEMEACLEMEADLEMGVWQDWRSRA